MSWFYDTLKDEFYDPITGSRIKLSDDSNSCSDCDYHDCSWSYVDSCCCFRETEGLLPTSAIRGLSPYCPKWKKRGFLNLNAEPPIEKEEIDMPLESGTISISGISTIHMMPISMSAAQDQMKCLVKGIKKVIFADPATIIYWGDDTKTVVKCGELDEYDPEKGIAMCMLKKMLGNEGNYNNLIRDAMEKGGEVK